MVIFNLRFMSVAFVISAMFGLLTSQSSQAQLEITEVMYNPIDEDAWEWFEVRNNSGMAVDLDGAYIAKLGGSEVDGPAIDGSASNTIIPANGLGVIYNADLGQDDQSFRDAWGLGGGVSLIGASNLPPLSNSGSQRNFALWANQSDYVQNLELNLESNEFEVTGLIDAVFSLDYTPSEGSFPSAPNGSSIRWTGNGDYQVGANWGVSDVSETGVTTSLQVTAAGNTNSTDDVGNPGIVPAGSAASGLLITEIMYDPRSDDVDWEWVEIYNNTGSTIDFGSNNYVLDDDDDNNLGAANITTGTVANGSVAVLFDGAVVTQQDMIDAWDPGGLNGTNFIAVDGNWTGGYANGGDTVAIWSSIGDYNSETDPDPGPRRTTGNAVAVVNYDDDPGEGWPNNNGDGSIYLSDLTADPSLGASWNLSGALGDTISFNAAGLTGIVEIHPGGDIGSPGSFSEIAVADVDLDNDGDVDGADFLLIQRTNPSLIPDWQAQYPLSGSVSAIAAVPEPASIGLVGLALVCIPFARRK